MSRSIVTGIDAGTGTVKVIVADGRERNNNGLPKILAAVSVEAHGLSHGYITDMPAAADGIRRAVAAAEAKAGVRIKKAFVSIGGMGLGGTAVSSTVMTSRADARITSMDLDKAVEQCETDLPAAAAVNRRIVYSIPIEHKIDGVPAMGDPTGMIGNKLETKCLIVTCLERHAADMVAAVNEAGIEVEDVMASPIVAGFAVLNRTQKTAGCVLCNIGAETTSVAVFENGLPVSTEVFPIGSADATNDIAIGLRLPLEEAEQIKIGAITGSSFPRKKLEDIVSARLSDIFELVDGHLRKLGRSGLLPAGIVIIGGGAAFNSTEAAAKTIMKLPARVGAVIGDNAGKSSAKDAVWSVAYGLCVWGLHTEEGPAIDPSMMFLKRSLRAIASWFKQFLP